MNKGQGIAKLRSNQLVPGTTEAKCIICPRGECAAIILNGQSIKSAPNEVPLHPLISASLIPYQRSFFLCSRWRLTQRDTKLVKVQRIAQPSSQGLGINEEERDKKSYVLEAADAYSKSWVPRYTWQLHILCLWLYVEVLCKMMPGKIPRWREEEVRKSDH